MNSHQRTSALSSRIAAGKADPISDEEREIVAGLRDYYNRKYGNPMNKAQAPEKHLNISMLLIISVMSLFLGAFILLFSFGIEMPKELIAGGFIFFLAGAILLPFANPKGKWLVS